MHDEFELKLAVSPDNLLRLRRHPLVRSLALGRARTRTLVTTYYDTPDRDLLSQGMSLRIRRIGARRIQTIKALADTAVRSLKHYREYEAELGGDTPDLDLIDDEDLLARLRANGLEDKLAPVFTTSFRRASIPLKFADSELELALDQGEITAGEAQAPICEAELELVTGRSVRIYELALALGERIPFKLERRTKASRGYALTQPKRLAAVKAQGLSLKSGMTAREAFEAAARSCLTQICANEPVVLAGNNLEGVHQMRVGVRRLRALVSAFRPILLPDAAEYLREELRWLQQSLGPAREWDVFIDETLAPLTVRQDPPIPGLDRLVEAAKAMQAEAYKTARAALGEQRYTEMLLRLDLWLEDGGWALETPAKAGGAAPCDQRIDRFARQVLDKRDKRLRKLSKRQDDLTEAEMHGIRLLAKKKRYCLEFFGSLYPRRAVRAALASLKFIQDSLGTYNDALVGGRLLTELETEAEPKAAAEMTQAIWAVRGWRAAHMDADIRNFRQAWQAYEVGKRFWRV